MREALHLDPDPRSVSRARDWVVGELSDLGRPDLVDAATLGISELVTNAILHAEPPITVAVLGSRERPRVEVRDRSKRPPRTGGDMTDADALMRTVGRGMAIVALYSQAWGADVSPDGKVVWFVPSPDPGVDVAESGDVFVLEEAIEELGVAVDERLLDVHLLGMPAQVFASFREWYAEIRRELRLLAFAHPDRFPVATELVELTLQTETERRHARGIEQLDNAIRSGAATVDLHYRVPASSPATMARMNDLLARADRFCRDQSLLTMPATPQQLALLDWYAGEFTRQAAGHEPQAWSGSSVVEPPTT
ncbi:ATP-binding protein [Nocardioides iriomotensis]|uniref:ATP-binding protein n=1 Tax=Nocardioides iriomotensis TaxID=715784 RepID=A0A4Q5IX36_9ACTN|nr:ATP-binding protein [Nocardioides iriomotensis]RYU10707.1 ATP-binding protein [Nocardioides iriomotensis]